MVRYTTKRGFLASLGAASVAGLTGCLGLGGSSTSTPEATGTTSTSIPENATSTETPGDNEAEDGRYATTSLDDFEDLSKWKAVMGALEPSEREAYRGSQSAHVTLNGSDQLVWIRRDVDWDLSEKNLSFALNVAQPARQAIVTLRLHAPDSNNALTAGELVRLEPGQGWFRIDAGVRSVSGAPDLSEVTRVDLMLKPVGGGPADFRVDDLRSVPSFDRGYVALTFDDGLASQYEAFRAMRRYDMPATVATAPAAVGTDGHLSIAQMREMRRAGWEFATHPRTDTPLSALSTERAERLLADSRAWMRDNGFETGAASLVYPFGEWNRDVIRIAERHGFDAGYRYLGGYGSGTGPITDPWTISRGDGTNVTTVKTALNFASIFNGLRIFAFHGVGRGDDAVPLRAFEKIVDYIDRQDLTVVTLSEINCTLTAETAAR